MTSGSGQSASRTGFERCSNFSPPTGVGPAGADRGGLAAGALRLRRRAEPADGPASTGLVEPPLSGCGNIMRSRFSGLRWNTVSAVLRGCEGRLVGVCVRGERVQGGLEKQI